MIIINLLLLFLFSATMAANAAEDMIGQLRDLRLETELGQCVIAVGSGPLQKELAKKLQRRRSFRQPRIELDFPWFSGLIYL